MHPRPTPASRRAPLAALLLVLTGCGLLPPPGDAAGTAPTGVLDDAAADQAIATAAPGSALAALGDVAVRGRAPRTGYERDRFGDGWVTTGPSGDPEAPGSLPDWWAAVAGLAGRFDEALTEAGRSRDSVSRYLDLDSAPIYSLSSTGAFTDAVGRAADLGFTDVVTHWPRAEGWYAGSEKVLETAAGLLPRLRAL